ncbi:branched-chain amino acid transport system substrate-binding protein [Cricetibacter osteomyelitidis]|uniref:Branched-chain amino acid transport system substrate-binding protein n=1 Tax=Cricetibacter osteomyelitidis TaxID=1521931 RepID=A0A4R2SXV7_9PAST|nr:LuxR C-terminal-related transcriptional regulator [Cricetibacter osteomyelitidis]TCP95359.1 branched-chain amino acid transport system substrate-binding protein [Cricetibacter osteomyelitidis]
MNMRTNWSCLVDNNANLSQWEDKAGMEYLTVFTQVIHYAQALIHSTKDSLHFYYHAENAEWLHIYLQRYQDSFCIVQAEQVSLPFELSKRELDILTLLSSGLSNGEIAEQLHISERTVAKHIENIFTKTNTENRTALAVFAVVENLCCLPLPCVLKHSVLSVYEIEKIAHQLLTSSHSTFAIRRSKSRPIIIGVPYVEKGIGKIDTQELLNGSLLAVNKINQQGGIQGREVRLETVGFCVDDKASIRSAYQQLFEREVDAISTSYACYSPEIHDLVAGSGMPYLHIATHSDSDKRNHNLSTYKIDNIFQVCASDTNYGAGVLRFLQAYQQHYSQLIAHRHLLVIQVKWQRIDIGIDKLISDLKALHWKVDVLELDQTAETFQYAMKQIHNLNPALIVLASYFAEDIVNFYQDFLRAPINAILYSIYAPSAFLPHNQPCEGVLWSTTSGLSNNYAGKQFVRQYQQFFGYQPTYSQASIAYDQINILANVWRNSVSPRMFKDVLRGMRAMLHHGVNGTYYFGSDSQIGLAYPDNTTDLSISLPHLIYQVQQGKSAVIMPDLFAETTFKLPHWFNLKS